MAPALSIAEQSSHNAAMSEVPILQIRTLLLAPPSISSHENTLRTVLAAYDRKVTDVQMLDRISASLVSLPEETYDVILLLACADGTWTELSSLLGRDVFASIVRALKTGGRIQAQGGSFAKKVGAAALGEAIMAGLVPEGDEMVKLQLNSTNAVPLRVTRKDRVAGVVRDGPEMPNQNERDLHKILGTPFGAGLPDHKDGIGYSLSSGTADDGGDDELIDEDALLTEDDLRRPANIPPECVPRYGRRRRACMDCTCGLAERIAAEDAVKRANADTQLQALKIGVDDLAEVDFTVQGKVGSCGNCSLGDAFRCEGCPYLGMPAFASRPGGEVRLLNNDVQL